MDSVGSVALVVFEFIRGDAFRGCLSIVIAAGFTIAAMHGRNSRSVDIPDHVNQRAMKTRTIWFMVIFDLAMATAAVWSAVQMVRGDGALLVVLAVSIVGGIFVGIPNTKRAFAFQPKD